ncbi:MAG: hypothetical protein ACOCVN_02720, partial [bacterium]
ILPLISLRLDLILSWILHRTFFDSSLTLLRLFFDRSSTLLRLISSRSRVEQRPKKIRTRLEYGSEIRLIFHVNPCYIAGWESDLLF